MRDDYEIIIGLEVHLQPKTNSKMFCSCSSNYFGAQPNTFVCPVCMGFPGALPVPNRKAIELCIKTSLALNCSINNDTKFDRKNYFYPDLPKGYQISQYDKPIGYNGLLEIDTSDGLKKIGITRVHQEEDTGKSIHNGSETLLDFNKSGVPLIEIVSEPDLRTKEEVTVYCKRLRQIVRYLDISNADMEKGEMRYELNMSLRMKGDKSMPKYKVEVKNIASISVLEKVIDYEYTRQAEILDNGETPIQETRGLVDMSGKTTAQRSKESAADYRYFPEPDIPLIEISEDTISTIRKEIVELPNEKKKRYVDELGIDSNIAEIIISDVGSYKEFEDTIANLDKKYINDLSKWYTGDYFSLQKVSPPHTSFTIDTVVELVKLVADKKLTRQNAKNLLTLAYKDGINIEKEIEKQGLSVVSDEGSILPIIEKIFSENSKAVNDAKGNPNAAMFLVGLAMRELKGQADAQVVKDIIFNKLRP